MTAKDNKIDKKIYAQLIPVIIGGVLCFAILIHTFVLIAQKGKETAEFGSEAGTGISMETGTEIVWHAYPYTETSQEPSIPPISPPVNNRHEDETEKEIFINPEIEKLYDVPKMVLDLSTKKLLEYFMDSSFMYKYFELGYSSFWTPEKEEQMAMMDFSRHEAFRELVAREDLVPELEKYADTLWVMDWSYPAIVFSAFLNQDEVRARVDTSTGNYPNLREIYEEMERGR